LPLNDLRDENPGTAGRIGELRLGVRCWWQTGQISPPIEPISVGWRIEDVWRNNSSNLVMGRQMIRKLPRLAAKTVLLIGLLAAVPALGEKPGGILKMYHFDSPASLSLHKK
jgi:hypothetical protein